MQKDNQRIDIIDTNPNTNLQANFKKFLAKKQKLLRLRKSTLKSSTKARNKVKNSKEFK